MDTQAQTASPHPETAAWRLFLAVPLPDGTRAEIGDLSTRLQKGARFTTARLSWVQPDSIHLTLAFLGDTAPEKVEAIAAAAGRAAGGFSPLRIEIKRLGVFPDWHRPRVLWAGLRDRTHQIETLQRALADALERIGLPSDRKPFRPHLTLARIKSLAGLEPLRSIVESHQEYRLTPFGAGELVMFRSELNPAGAIHTPLGRFAFSAAPPPDAPE